MSTKTATVNTMVKKLVLIPVGSDTKEHNKKIRKFLSDKVDRYTDWVNNAKAKDKKIAQAALEKAKQDLDDIDNGVIPSERIVNDYTYSLVRNACASEAMMKNTAIHRAYGVMLNRANEWARTSYLISDDKKLAEKKVFDKETTKMVNESFKECTRVAKTDPQKMDSAMDGLGIDNILGGYGFAWSQQLKSAFWNSFKSGLLQGEVAPPHFKKNSPFTVAKDTMGFTSDYETVEETIENWNDKMNLYFCYGSNKYSTICCANPTIAKFKIDVGHRGNRVELLTTLQRLYSGEYTFCGSSIQMDKNDKKIILNLVVQSPIKSVELDEKTVVGVDIGVAIPAFCALNNNVKIRKSIGNGKDFAAKREQIKAQSERIKRSTMFSSGGHGRKKKLKSLDKFREHESNYRNTYNHKVAKQVVDFAVKNHAKYINIESLKGISEDSTFLKTWPFFDLQTKIKYKAERYGITVRSVNPCYTSQICSACGCYHPDNRESQSEFVCKNCGNTMNADRNAAINIARIDKKLILKDGDSKTKATLIKEAQEFYGIVADVKSAA